jgi:protocatechuate 3,4-dioxygenase beta subunit
VSPGDLDRRRFLGSTGLGLVAVVVGCVPDGSGGKDSGADSGSPEESGETGSEPDPTGSTGETAETGGATGSTGDTGELACADTPADIEGPFYLPGVPVREELDLYGDAGPRLTVTGRVLDAACAPIPGVVVEIWHVAPDGAYDNTSPEMRYRGQTLAAADGGYRFHTLMPVYYGGRPMHLHLKVWRGGVEELTSQVYFEDDPQAAGQDPALIVPRLPDGADYTCTFDIVV